MGVVEREARATGIEHPGEHLVEGCVEALEEIPRHSTLAMIVGPDSVGMTSRLVLNSERLANVALEITMPVMRPAEESGLLRDGARSRRDERAAAYHAAAGDPALSGEGCRTGVPQPELEASIR